MTERKEDEYYGSPEIEKAIKEVRYRNLKETVRRVTLARDYERYKYKQERALTQEQKERYGRYMQIISDLITKQR